MALAVPHRPTWWQFTTWALCGASAGFILAAAFAFGPLAALPTAAFAGLAVLIGGANISAIGSMAGFGAWGFVLAWLNRGGPGMVCHASQCDEEWSPWPFAAVGVVLVGAALTTFPLVSRRGR